MVHIVRFIKSQLEISRVDSFPIKEISLHTKARSDMISMILTESMWRTHMMWDSLGFIFPLVLVFLFTVLRKFARSRKSCSRQSRLGAWWMVGTFRWRNTWLTWSWEEFGKVTYPFPVPQNITNRRCSAWDGWGHTLNSWLVVWNIWIICPYWECHHPNWLSLHHFSGWGRYTNHQPDGFVRGL